MFEGLFDFIGGGVFAIFAIIIVVVLIVSYIGSRYKVAAANEALVVSGQRDKSPDGRRNLKVVRGGGVIVLPLVHKVGKLKLTARQINVNLADAVTRQGIKVAVQGVATFKIGADDESIRNAAERFLESQEEAVDSIVKNVLEGSLRSIVGTLTVEELNLDRMKFQQAVQDAAKGDLATSGLQIDSFTIQAIRDESGYMELIGQQETARRERDARMAKASADQEAAVREAEAEQVKINASRDVALRRAETETQTAAAEARAAQAGPLAEAEATQEVTRKQTELAQLEAARKEQELVATTVRPAEADAAAQIRRAEGAKGAAIAQAQGDAERVKLAGEAQARVGRGDRRGRRQADDPRGQRRGRHRPVQGRGGGQGPRAARRGLPPVQRGGHHPDRPLRCCRTSSARPPSRWATSSSLTVLSNDGASDVVKNVTRTVTEASATVKGLTGIDIPEMLSQAIGGSRERIVVRIRRLEDAPAERAEERRIREHVLDHRPAGPRPRAADRPPGARRRAARAHRRDRGSRRAPASAGHAADLVRAPPPRFTTPEAVDAAIADAERAVRAASAPPKPRTDTAAGPARPALGRDHPRNDRRRCRDPAGGRPSRRARHRALRGGPPR